MKIVLFFLCFCLITPTLWGSTCSTLRHELKQVQQAQSNLDQDDKTLASLQIERDRLVAKLAIDSQIATLRDRYLKDSEKLAQSKQQQLEEIRENLISKIQNLEKMGLMVMAIDDVLRHASDDISIDNPDYIDPTSGGQSSSEYFIKKIAAICTDHPKPMICQNLDTTTYSSTLESMDKDLKESLELFYKVYSNDDLSSEIRQRDLNKFKNQLTAGIPELESSGIFYDSSELNKLTFVDHNLLTKLQEYSDSSDAKYVKNNVTLNLSNGEDSLYQKLKDCVSNPISDGQKCSNQADELAYAIETYTAFTAEKLEHAGNFTADMNNMFADDLNQLRQMFATKQPNKVKDLLSLTEHNKLRNSLKTNYELIAKHRKFAGEPERVEPELALLRLNPEDGHMQLIYKRLYETGLCDRTIIASPNYDEDNLATCLALLGMDDHFDRPQELITKTEKQISDIDEKIAEIKNTKKYKELEEFKTALAQEAQAICGDSEFSQSSDTISICNGSYLSDCMTNNMNNLELLGNVIAEIDKSLDTQQTKNTRHDNIEQFCKNDDLKKLAAYSCSGIATTNEVLRNYTNYNNGDFSQGRKESFGNLFNEALARQLPSSVNTWMNYKFYQPFYYDSLYQNALYTKQMEHWQTEWQDIQFQWWDSNGWIDHDSYFYWDYMYNN